MISTILSGLLVLACIGSLVAWKLAGMDPLTQIARGAIYARTAIRVGSNVGREAFKWWLSETRRSYEMARIAEGCR